MKTKKTKKTISPWITALTMPILAAAATWSPAADVTHHDLKVSLDPAAHRLQVSDHVTLGADLQRADDGSLQFMLHAGLTPEVTSSSGWRLDSVSIETTAEFLGINATTESNENRVPLDAFRLVPTTDVPPTSVELTYGGVIYHPLATQGEEYQRSFSETPGIISEEGIFLAGTSYWVPDLGSELVSFELEVAGLEAPWKVVSQGQRSQYEADGSTVTNWSFEHPSEEIYLVAGPWFEYRHGSGKVEALAFLRQDDPALASRYLDATARYLKLYEGLLGPFPFPSFALVENFWETGYGMPGFTLLGPQVIRFPWILTSSYPHELLHNWWGNSAYVDFDQGNWCEGLTAYMADHLFAEQKGQASTYRRSTLKKFSDFVSSGADFPLRDFSSRRSAASEAVGYGKSLMLFHMVRQGIGDENFVEALRQFYRDHRFRSASFADLGAAFSAASGEDWSAFVSTWTERLGAPQISLSAVEVIPPTREGQLWQLQIGVRQNQEGDPFPITVPVAVTLEGQDEPLWLELEMKSRGASVVSLLENQPLRVDVDPNFDVMRRLDPLEVPPALSTVLGVEDALFVLPSAASPEEQAAWRQLAVDWAAPDEPRILLDSELTEAPGESAWILGWDNLFATEVAGRLDHDDVELGDDSVELAGDRLTKDDLSLVLIARGESDPETALGLITAAPIAAIPGLARKLPHYSRYSFLAFRGDEPGNVAKGLWQPRTSPLVRQLGDGPMPALKLSVSEPLADLPPAFDADQLLSSVTSLSDPSFEGRGLGSEGLELATSWVESKLLEMGLEPAGEDGFRQSWSFTGGSPERSMTLTNLIARIPGSDPSLAPVLVLAHLDHLGRGWPDARAGNEDQVHPGADDNASGVAVLLELARTLKADGQRPRTVNIAVVTGEEAGLIGSRHLLESMTDKLPFACVNLDTVGRLSEGKLYVIDAGSAREWRFIFMGVGYTTGAPVAVVAEPLDSSDQKACLEHGVPAVQLFTGPTADYHRPSDSADKIDGAGLVTVTEATHETVGYLAERREAMTVTIEGQRDQPKAAAEHGGGRRVSLGTVPDFAFKGLGVRVDDVLADSPAAAAGIILGDVVIRLGEHEISDLRSYSTALKAHAPGDAVAIVVVRDGTEITVDAVLVER